MVEFASSLKLRPGSKRVPKSKFDFEDIAVNGQWRKNKLNLHAWECHPGAAKNGLNQLPSTKLYDQGAKNTIRSADIVIESTKGDILLIDSKTGLVTGWNKFISYSNCRSIRKVK